MGRGHRFITFRPLLFFLDAFTRAFSFSFSFPSSSSLELWCCHNLWWWFTTTRWGTSPPPLCRLPPCMIIHTQSMNTFQEAWKWCSASPTLPNMFIIFDVQVLVDVNMSPRESGRDFEYRCTCCITTGSRQNAPSVCLVNKYIKILYNVRVVYTFGDRPHSEGTNSEMIE